MYKLSIIIPIYKVENYIESCLISVLDQLPSNVEIICVNDGSPDNSMAKAKQVVEKYGTQFKSQFKFIDQENQGLSGARNTGIDLSKGEYIGFLDSDDKLMPNYFSKLIAILDKDMYDIIDFNFITSEGEVTKVRRESFDSIFSTLKWYSWARVCKRYLLEEIKFTVGVNYEDMALTPQLYINAKKIYFINAPLYWYRSNEEGITRTFNQKNNLKTIESLEFICDKYLRLYFQSDNPYYAIVAIHSYFFLCTSACRRFNVKKSFELINKYQPYIKKIKSSQLPIDYALIDSKIIAFYRIPRLYILLYSGYDRFRS